MTATKTKRARKARPKISGSGVLSGEFRQNIGFAVAQALESGESITANELVKRLGCTYPTVWQALKRLVKAGKIKRTFTEPKDGAGRGEFVFSL